MRSGNWSLQLVGEAHIGIDAGWGNPLGTRVRVQAGVGTGHRFCYPLALKQALEHPNRTRIE